MQNAKTFKLGNKTLHLLSLTTVGSKLHNLVLNNSDTDLKGVFVWSFEDNFLDNEFKKSLSYSNTDKKEWKLFVADLNKELNLNLKDDDDLSLFELREFTRLSLKNDMNMLDMLFSTNDVFTTPEFKLLKSLKMSFLDASQAKSRFFGMSANCLSNFKKNNKRVKDAAKSLQMLLSLEQLLNTLNYSPSLLNDKDRLLVLSVKNGDKDLDFVLDKFKELDNRVNELVLTFDFESLVSDNKFVENNMLKVFKSTLL